VLFLACATMLLDSYALYSPATLAARPEVLWVGGWRTEADIGPDRIYRLNRTTGELTLALARPDAHVNDPSLLQPPSSGGWDRAGWTFMYYTGLDNADAAAQAWDRHWIGLASSVDGGETWWDHGRVLDGWSPSALVVDAEVWVYFHDAAAQPWRIRLAGNGWEPLGLPEPVTGLPPVSNLDVTGQGPFILAANTPDLSGLVGATSADGLRFEVIAQVGVPAAWLLTPHIGPDRTLYVGRSETAHGTPTRVLEWRR
jgi:hypothetical protein